MTVGVVDIGTNSIRLLITDGNEEVGRWVEITGLGRGVDQRARLSEEAIVRAVEVLGRFGDLMDQAGVERRMAFATSASRDAANREELFDAAEAAIGVRPELISGGREAILAYDGATMELSVEEPVVVSDIGGGSTELVTYDSGISVEIGSVRLTERHLPDRPARQDQMRRAWDHLRSLFDEVQRLTFRSHVGVAGTWTSLAAMAQELPSYERSKVHGFRLSGDRVRDLVDHLAGLSVEETAAIRSLDPKRAPVILAGAMVAVVVLETVGVDEAVVSERDTLDGAAMELLDLA